MHFSKTKSRRSGATGWTPSIWRSSRNLGNAATHTNQGDVSKQQVFEAGLIREVQVLFIELLDEIYEQPEQRKGRLAALKRAADSFRSEKAGDSEGNTPPK